MKNLFVVRSPLQLINSIEAVDYFKLKNNILVIIHNRSIVNKEQMKCLINMVEWEEVIHVEESYKSKFFKYLGVIKYLKKQPYKYVFVGELGISYKMIIANIRKEKVFLLDDGTATVDYYNKFIRQDKYNKYNFREIRFLFFGLKIKIRDKINLFTYFNLEPVNKNEVIRNELAYLRMNYLDEAKKDSDVIYFIGQTSEVFMNIDMYIKDIENLIIKFNKKIVYIPHRSESKEQENAVLSIKSDLFTIKKLELPLELYFLYNNIYPLHIISYFSTALVTLSILFKECKAEYIKVSKNSINEKRIKNIENCYILFHESGIRKLDI